MLLRRHREKPAELQEVKGQPKKAEEKPKKGAKTSGK
jgi:hypothetical protein